MYSEDFYCLECWYALNEFLKADFGDNQFAAVTLRELAEDIFSLYLSPDASKYIGDVPDDIVEELSTLMNHLIFNSIRWTH